MNWDDFDLGPRYYVLDGTEPRQVGMMEWAQEFDLANRRVAETLLGRVRISTVFLGLDHSYSLEGPPLIFETLVFGGPLDGEMLRCSTWEEAEAAHEAIVVMVKGAGGGRPCR